MKVVQLAPLLGCLILLHSVAAVAQDDAAKLTLSAGAEFTSGACGGDMDIEETYITLTAAVSYGRIGFRLSVPYLSAKAPEGTIFDSDGEPVPGTGALATESGLGDIIGGVTLKCLQKPSAGSRHGCKRQSQATDGRRDSRPAKSITRYTLTSSSLPAKSPCQARSGTRFAANQAASISTMSCWPPLVGLTNSHPIYKVV
jgi:hypothetical protein